MPAKYKKTAYTWVCLNIYGHANHILTRAGPLLGAERARPEGLFEYPPPSNSAPGPLSDTR